jgi:hypothetical protein
VLWDVGSGTYRFVGRTPINVNPVAINQLGLVLAQARTGSGRRLAVTCAPGEDWQELGTPEEWFPSDMKDVGDVVGWTVVENSDRPWLHTATGQTLMLPFVAGHSTSPRRINSVGQIVGTAGTDHGSHALVWSPADHLRAR